MHMLVVVFVIVFFTLTDLASTITGNIIRGGQQSGTWSADRKTSEEHLFYKAPTKAKEKHKQKQKRQRGRNKNNKMHARISCQKKHRRRALDREYGIDY